MFLHLIVAAALLAPGQSVSTVARHTAAMVCSLAAESHPAVPGSRPASNGRPPATNFTNAAAPRLTVTFLTTQLRR